MFIIFLICVQTFYDFIKLTNEESIFFDFRSDTSRELF